VLGVNEGVTVAEGNSSKSQSVSACFVHSRTAPQEADFDRPPYGHCPPMLSDCSHPAHPTCLSHLIPTTPRGLLSLIPHSSVVSHLAAAAGSPKPTSQPASNSSPYSHPQQRWLWMWGGSVEGSVGSFEGVVEAWRSARESLIMGRLLVGFLEA
jgi:hypothetical protein